MLYGRAAECDAIDALLEGARHGRSGSLVLRGEAGIGKTTLLQYAADHAGDCRVLRARGAQAESAMPFAGLHALMHPVRSQLPSLSGPQRRALGIALGIEEGEVPNAFLVAAAVVELLSTLAEDRAVVCLVDDAQWLDPPSLEALTFAHRRTGGDRMAMLFTLRVEMPESSSHGARLLADLPQLSVGPIDSAAADRLLGERPELDQSARADVKATARGNPLALLALSTDGRGLTITEHLEAEYLSRAAELSPAVRHLLLLAAADDTGDLAVLLAAAGQQGVTEAHLSAAEERGLLSVSANSVEFTHPLVRSAVYQNATSGARRGAHLALATALDRIDPIRATWHRASGAVPPNETVAAELAELGGTAARRSAVDVAARAFARAAELTVDERRRRSWWLDAAEACWASGQVKHAKDMLARADEAPCSDDEPGRIEQLRGRLEAATGSAQLGHQILLEGAERIIAADPERAAAMLFEAVRAASIGGDLDRVRRAGEVAAGLLGTADHPPYAAFAAGVADLLTDRAVGTGASLDSAIRAASTDDPQLLSMAATASAFTGDFARTQALASRAVTRCRQTGALAVLAHALEPLVITQLDTAPRQAEASADEGLRAARETHQIPSAAIHLASLATVAALRGDRQTTESLTEEVLGLDRAHGLAYPAAMALAARGLLELGLGRPAEAMVHYQSLSTARHHRAVELAATDFALLAALWSGHEEQARDRFTAIVAGTWLREADADWAAAAVDRWTAMLAPEPEATTMFERSLARQERSPRLLPYALTHLLFGEHLRRIRRRSAARPHLRRALETFERLDASPWAARARGELRATGESVRRCDDTAARLTPQELQVAQLVATGASTKTVAAQLYLSPRTVDSHLRQIFAKLGISSRSEIRGLDLG